MGAKFVEIDRETGMLLPPDLREWVKGNDLVHLIVEAVELCEVRTARVNERGTGSSQYPPSMMLALLIYNYAMGVFSSRRIERQTFESVSVRYICANTHPDHDTIAKFRRENGALIHECFVRVLQMARAMGLLKMGTIIIDGTKIRANASKRHTHQVEDLKKEVRRCLEAARVADEEAVNDGSLLPEELANTEVRQARLRQAQASLEAGEAEASRGEEPPGGSGRGTPRINTTDPDSALMPAPQGGGFIQGFNAQAVTCAQPSPFIIHTRISSCSNDLRELQPVTESIDSRLPAAHTILADTGYDNNAHILALEARGLTVYCPPQKPRPRIKGGFRETKKRRLRAAQRQLRRERIQSQEGQKLYALRRRIEPVFHTLKNLMGFRQFLLRGMAKVSLEWELLALAFNCRKLACAHSR